MLPSPMISAFSNKKSSRRGLVDPEVGGIAVGANERYLYAITSRACLGISVLSDWTTRSLGIFSFWKHDVLHGCPSNDNAPSRQSSDVNQSSLYGAPFRHYKPPGHILTLLAFRRGRMVKAQSPYPSQVEETIFICLVDPWYTSSS